MRLHRFFIQEQLSGKKKLTILDEQVIHQWKNVFRLEAGEKVILLDNSGSEFLSEIELISKEKAEVNILESRIVDITPIKELWLFAALIKKDNYEWIIEKGTEIGVSHFIPVVSERSEKKNLNMERAHKIITEASEQSGRGTMPTVIDPIDLETAIKTATIPLIAFHTTGEKFVADFHNSKQQIGVLIGPEGGWSEKEIILFHEHNIPVFSLGKQVFRAETAAIVIPALLLI